MGSWIESHQDLGSSAKTKRAARLLGVPLAQVVGHLHMLWWWALDHAFDGDLADFDALDIADAAGWDGDPDVFVRALVDCGPGAKAGFLDDHHGELAIHDWREHTAPLRAKREASAKAHHARWHVGRGVFEPDCSLCVTAGLDAGTGHPRAPDAPAPAPASDPHSDSGGAAVRDGADRTAPTEPGPTGPDQEEEGPRAHPTWDLLARRCPASRWAEVSAFPGRRRLMAALTASEDAGWPPGQSVEALLAGHLGGHAGAVLVARAEALAAIPPTRPAAASEACPDCNGAGVVWPDDGSDPWQCGHTRARSSA